MKKVFLFMALLFAVMTVSAQSALEEKKVLDNISVGASVGAYSPLDFNSVNPFNTTVGLRIGKAITPIVGLEIEGNTWLNDNHFADASTIVKATDVALNGKINLSNLIGGYNGLPRTFEVSTVTGLGWLHVFEHSQNYLTCNLGLDLAFNMGREKEHAIAIIPMVKYNLSHDGGIEFNKNHAQLGISLAYRYTLPSCKGRSRHFAKYDIGKMNSTINALRADNDKLIGDNAKLAEALQNANAKSVPTTNAVTKVASCGKWVVCFAKNSAELTEDAKMTLNEVGADAIVDIVGMASPEGTKEYNQALSEKRAEAVATYLKDRGNKINSAVGKGVVSDASNRLVIVTITE